jgi:hypothetical protein
MYGFSPYQISSSFSSHPPFKIWWKSRSSSSPFVGLYSKVY